MQRNITSRNESVVTLFASCCMCVNWLQKISLTEKKLENRKNINKTEKNSSSYVNYGKFC